MIVATSRVEVGVRNLKNNLSHYVARARAGEEIVVTDHGRPVARLSPLGHQSDSLANLVASGALRPPKNTDRHLPASRIEAQGSVSELVAEQRR